MQNIFPFNSSVQLTHTIAPTHTHTHSYTHTTETTSMNRNKLSLIYLLHSRFLIMILLLFLKKLYEFCSMILHKMIRIPIHLNFKDTLIKLANRSAIMWQNYILMVLSLLGTFLSLFTKDF